MATVIPISSASPTPINAYAAERILQQPRFADPVHIEARKILALFDLARRCCRIAGFCVCKDGCYNREHWSGKPGISRVRGMDLDELLEVIERLVELGKVEQSEFDEARFGC
jgi:hypothetical protein